MSTPKNFDPSLLEKTPEAEPQNQQPEKTTTEGTPTTTTPDSSTQPDIYAQRRKRGKQVLAAALLIAAFLWYVKPWTGPEGLQNTPTASVVEETDTAALLDSQSTTEGFYNKDMEYAENYYRQNGTFDNIRLEGAHVAARDTTLLVARTHNETCYAYGIMEQQHLELTTDPSGSACAGQIVAVQQQLDNDYETRTTKAHTDAETSLRKAAESVIFQASRNFVNGVPSTDGLPATIDGALVLENTGEYALLRVSHPDVCLETYVTAAGEIGEINNC